uniref:Probable protein phosphatase 2C 42 n=1 Tax=Cicer arietinum TaxID=3827 RepID=A0A3Q7XQZ5_CICAR|nr:probable protein phosphatase 2C 42 [Cicer arietinum]
MGLSGADGSAVFVEWTELDGGTVEWGFENRHHCENWSLQAESAVISRESQGVVTAETIQAAFRLIEKGFTAMVSELWNTRPQVATTGTCCLVGVIFQQTLFIANVGDYCIVLGKKVGNTGGVAAIQLSPEHNANLEGVRQELRELHPYDPQIVVLKHGVWRVKGITII